MTTIRDLPDEILIEIFSLLSPKMLQNCNLVCKYWDDLISNSLVLMDQYEVRLRDYDSEEKEVTRRIDTVFINDLSMMESIHYYELDTLIIDVQVANSTDLDNFVQAINSLETLRHLAVFFLVDILPKHFKSIHNKLEILHTTSLMVNLFSCDTLEVLELLWDSNLQFDRKAEALEFLNKQENLLELKLGDTESEFIDDDYYDYTDFMDDDDYGHDFFSTPNLEEFKPIFSLEKFSFTCTSLKFERHAELILFLNSQKNTLQSLSLSLHAATIETIEKIQKFVLEKLLKVTKLGFFINVQDDFRSDSEPMNNDEPNHATAVTNNINEFRFRGLHRSLDENKRFIDKFENLKHLYLRAVYRDDFKLLDYISITKLNLVSLKLDRFDASFEGMPRVYFPKLKTLFIGYFEHNVRNWTQRKERIFNLFIQKHEITLEEISIKFNSVSKLTIEAIIGCRRLKCLEFHCDEFVETKSLQLFMKVLEDVPCKLPKLTLKLPGHSFVFPDDERFWDKLYPKPPVPVLVKNFFKFMLHVVLFVMFFRFILKPISLFLYEFILARI